MNGIPGFPNAPMKRSTVPANGSGCLSDALIIVKGWVELGPTGSLIDFTYAKHYLCLDCHQRWVTRPDAKKHLQEAAIARKKIL